MISRKSKIDMHKAAPVSLPVALLATVALIGSTGCGTDGQSATGNQPMLDYLQGKWVIDLEQTQEVRPDFPGIVAANAHFISSSRR